MTRGRALQPLPLSGLVLVAASLILSCATAVEDDLWGVGGGGDTGGAEAGGASGNGGAANGGSPDKGGSSNGGSANKGGSSSGGASSGGASNGGSANKGGSSSGGSANKGGSSNGGSPGYGGSSTGGSGTYPGCEMGSSDPVCDACFQTQCGLECATCSANLECGYLLDCLQTCMDGDTMCEDDCFYYYEGGVDDLIALLGSTSGCVSINCTTECQ